jgi:hypothetical protein
MTMLDEAALEQLLATGDEWQSWRALRLVGDDPGPPPSIPYQDLLGGFFGAAGGASPGATGEALCHLSLIGLGESAPAAIAADWLDDARTPAGAWLDRPGEVPGVEHEPAGSRVWATASAVCGWSVAGRPREERAVALLRGESGSDGRFTGGAYPTFAAAGAFWKADGPGTETTEWALRWVRDAAEDWWGPWERATALTFWAAAGVPAEHATVDRFLDDLRRAAPTRGWGDDRGLTLRTLELVRHLWG